MEESTEMLVVAAATLTGTLAACTISIWLGLVVLVAYIALASSLWEGSGQ